MASNATLNIAALDPDTWKQSFITYCTSLPQYSGYSFQGQMWNTLLDVLARATFLRSFYTNMSFNETFLYSAQLLDNIMSRAKELNYLPSSTTSSSTTANINIQTNGIKNFTIPKGTRFTGVNSNGSYVFTTSNVYYQTAANGTYNFSNVGFFEGTYTTDVFNIDTSIENQLFTLSNPSIDISSITVTVFQDNGANATIFQQATNLFNLTNNSSVYFIQPTSNSQYQIYFGDGVLSYQPQDGSIVQAYYRVTQGTDADGSSNFNLLDNLGAENSGVVTSITINAAVSGDGANAESISSIQLNAPLAYQTQGRGVTGPDYKSLILTQFPAVRDCYVYGGGISANAVQYGYVLISCVSTSGNPLTLSLKNQILNYLANVDVIHPFTQMIDANTLFVDVMSNVHVNFSRTAQTPDYFETQVIDTISNFSSSNLELYNTPLRLSQLTTAIDYVDNVAIVSNETELTLKRSIPLLLNTNNNISFTFANPIVAGSVGSDNFISSNGFNSYLTDQPTNTLANGTLFIVTLNSSNNAVNFASVGSITYANGNVIIPNFNISTFPNSNSNFFIFATPQNLDIYGAKNDIIEIDTVDGVVVNILSN